MSLDVYGDHAYVTPRLVRWARERLDLSIEAASSRVPVNPELWATWEAGQAQPTMTQAQTIAQTLYIPLGYLWLNEPPDEPFPLPDLRTMKGQVQREPSAELFDVVYDVLSKQEWYREYQEEEGAEPLPFIGRYPLEADPESVARDIRDTLGLDDEILDGVRRSEDFLRIYIRRAEDAGILVLRSGIVENNTHRPLDVREFRGFAVSDSLAPLVFINARDATTAQIFTLTHEIAHLWFVQSGVCSPDYLLSAAGEGMTVERLCNRVAAGMLMPRADLLHRWDSDVDAMRNLRTLARRYHVSRLAVLLRARTLGKVESGLYRSLYSQLSVANRNGERSSEGGNFHTAVVARNSRTLTATLLASLAAGRVMPMEAARLLNVRVKSLDGITQHVFGG